IVFATTSAAFAAASFSLLGRFALEHLHLRFPPASLRKGESYPLADRSRVNAEPFTPPRMRLRAIPCMELRQGFHFLTICASAPGHSPPTVAPACPPAGGSRLCSGE